MTLIAPGVWIVPVEPLPELALTIGVEVVDKPHLCTKLDLISNLDGTRTWGKCCVCDNRELYLQVAEHPAYCFCPTHWRPVLTPKVEVFRSLLAPVDSHEYT